MKKVLYVLGAGLVVGAIAAGFYFRRQRTRKHLRRFVSIKTLMIRLKRVQTLLMLLPQMSLCMRMLKFPPSEVYILDMKVQLTIMHDRVDVIIENIKVSESTSDELDDISAE